MYISIQASLHSATLASCSHCNTHCKKSPVAWILVPDNGNDDLVYWDLSHGLFTKHRSNCMSFWRAILVDSKCVQILKKERSLLDISSKNLKILYFPSFFVMKNGRNVGFIRTLEGCVKYLKLSGIFSKWKFHFLNMPLRRLKMFTKKPRN